MLLTMHVLLDTNIYLSDLTFGKPEHEALRNFLRTSRASIVMPNLVRREVEKNIKSKAEAELSKLRQLYIVSLGVIAEIPTNELAERAIKDKFAFELSRNRVQEVGYGEVSLEAIIERSLSETPPFKSKGKGFRDALIWYSLLEYLRTNPEHKVAFITDNSKDFGAGKLKPELIAELGALGFADRVHYFQSLSDFLTEYSEPLAFIDSAFVESSIIDHIEGFAETVDETDLDIDYPNREVEWQVADVSFEEAEIENFYIYRTTKTHYYLYVEVVLNFYVELEGYAYDWEFNHATGHWGHDMHDVRDHSFAYTTSEFELKVDKETHEVEIVG